MSRLLVLALALPLLASIATGPIAAQTPAAPPQAGWQTITSTHGYSFQVPSNWVTPSGQSSPFTDTAVQDPSGKELAFVSISSAAGLGGSDSASLAQQVAKRTSQALQESDSQTTILRGPDPVQIANAQAGVAVTLSVSDAQGKHIVGARAAVQGAAEYILLVGAPEDLYNSDSSVARILDSFQVVLPPSFGLSAEEAVIPMLASRVAGRDLSGYTADTDYETAPSTIAAQSQSPVITLRNYQNAGLVVRFSQRLTPASQPPAGVSDSVPTVVVSLFTDAAAAHAYATGQTLAPSGRDSTFDSTSLGVALGDAASAWHVSSVPLGQPSTGAYYIRWHRGLVAFALQAADRQLGQEQQTDAETLAAAVDAIEQARPAPVFGSATVTPPATEDQRLLAAIQLQAFFAPASAAPDGYTLAGSDMFHPANFVLNPTQLHRVDEQWKELVTAQQVFTSNQDNSAGLQTAAWLCADAGAAATAAADYAAGSSVTASRPAPPVQLGDTTYAYRASATDSNGNPRESVTLKWTHGALVLIVAMYGPPGSTSLDLVVSLAQRVEERFQDFPLPTAGVSGL